MAGHFETGPEGEAVSVRMVRIRRGMHAWASLDG